MGAEPVGLAPGPTAQQTITHGADPSESPGGPTSARAARRRAVRQEGLLALVSAVAAGGIVAFTLRLWSAHLNVPLATGGDVTLNLTFLRNMQSTGSVLHTTLLGAPFGQDLSPWPAVVGDTWHLVTLKLLSLVLTPAAALNVFYVMTFPVAAAVAYLCLRGLGVSRTFGVPLAAAYALLPFHFLRGESHVLLSSYFVVPLACLVAYWMYTGVVDFARSPRRYSWREWCTVATAVVLLGTGLYYAVFGLILVLAAAVLRGIATRSPRPLLTAVVISTVVGSGIAVSALPALLFDGAQGADDAVTGRTYAASEFFGLKIVNLLLPPSYHRLPFLADLTSATSESLIPGERTEALGLLGVLGLVVVTFALLQPSAASASSSGRRLRAFGTFVLISVLCATVAGLNGVLAVVGLSQLRAWNRMSVYIAFFALAGLGIAFGQVARGAQVRWHWSRRPAAAVAASLLVLGVAACDQTSPALTPDHEAIAAAWNADRAYFGQAEEVFGAEAAVFQLPYIGFPEEGTVESVPYNDHLWGYVHSDLAWSFGGIKGQDNDWQPLALQDGITAALPKLVVAGFDALYVNRLGYADGGAAIESEIIAVIGAQTPLVHPDGTLAIYDLRPYASRLRERGVELPSEDSVLRPVRLQFGEGFFDTESADGKTWRWGAETAHASMLNPSDGDAEVLIQGSVNVRSPDAVVTLTIGNDARELDVVDHSAQIALRVTIPSGATPLVLWTDSEPTTRTGETRDLRQQVVDLTVSTVG